MNRAARLVTLAAFASVLAFGSDLRAQEPGPGPATVPVAPPVPPTPVDNGFPIDPDQMLEPESTPSTLKLFALLTILSLAPAVLLMTTCFVRFVIVLGLLRQALGTQQLPPNQVLISLCLFLTLLVMAPVWKQAYDEGIAPHVNQPPGLRPDQRIPLKVTFDRTARPLKLFMLDQIDRTGNAETLWTFVDYQYPHGGGPDELNEQTVDLAALLPAYVLSELKTAFVIGFQLYLPFLVIDMVVASVLISMGMMMLPPVLVSLPFKLLLFVLIDGWNLVVGMLLESVEVARFVVP